MGFGKEVYVETFDLLCGDKIGSGMSRTVFTCALLPGYVVKVETGSYMFQNVLEWQIWQQVVGTKSSKWFAECKWISPSGKILIQERTRKPSSVELLEKVPIWFTDLKIDNWGMVSGREDGKDSLVCHDYGTNLIFHKGTETKNMQKTDWDNW